LPGLAVVRRIPRQQEELVMIKKAKPRPATARQRRSSSPAPTSKIDRMVAALRAPKGASITDLMQLTGWQMHSVRGAIAGAIKKTRGLRVSSEKAGDERVYRISGKT